MADSSIINKLYQRKMFRIAAGYLATAWLLWQMVDTTCPAFECSPAFQRTIFWLLLGGLPLTLAVAWINWKPAIVVGAICIAGIGIAVLIVGYEPSIEEPNVETVVKSAVEQARLPNSVAVLPIENLSPDPDNAYFAAGIHEEILNHLAKLSKLNVISRTSMARYADSDLSIPEIAAELNVEAIMEGSVRYADDRVLVTLQLIDSETDAHLWSESYNRGLADVFAIQADIAMNVANALEVEFSLEDQVNLERAPTNSPAAYALYLKALGTAATNFKGAFTLLTQAIALDPNFALAHRNLAVLNSYRLIQIVGNSSVKPQARAKVEAEVRRLASEAMRLDPSLVGMHALLAGIDVVYWRWDEAQLAFERALNAYPNDAGILVSFARLRSFQGRHDDAIQLMRHGLELSPTAVTNYVFASILAHAGQTGAALGPARRAVELNPASSIMHLWLARIESALGNVTEAANHLRITEQLMSTNLSALGLSSIAFTYSIIGYQEDALRVITQLESAAPNRELDAGNWVFGYLVLGDDDNAYNALQTVINRIKNNEIDPAFYNLQIIKSNAQAHPVLDEPRFVELRNQMK